MMVKKTMRVVLVFVGCVLLSGLAYASSAKDAWDGLAGKKFANREVFKFVDNDPELKNVLIYGDSISIGYTQTVRESLKDKANVYRIYCNGGDSGSFIKKMTTMHKAMCDKKNEGHWSFKWDVIHFNVGLHDLKYVVGGKLDKINGKQVNSTDQYAKNLSNIITYLNKLAPKAKLIFATTTPVPECERGRIAGDAVKYNKVALNVLKDHPQIIVNDLYEFTKPNQPKWAIKPGNVHFKADGQTAQGTEVARIIEQALANASQRKTHLFILSGQSNMAGLDPKISFTPTVETAFGKDNVIVVKDAQGGQPIRRWYKKWKPAKGDEPKATGDLYDRLMTKVNVTIEGKNIQTVTFVWMQGERDAREKHGQVYAASFKGLLDQLRQDLGRKDINFVIGRISDFDMGNKRYPHWTKVRKAQVAVAQADPRGEWVDTDDLNDGKNRKGKQISNDLHYSVQGYKTLGKRFADKAIALINKK